MSRHTPMRALLAGLIAVCVGLTTALISPTAKAADPYLTVSMTRTDTYGAPVRAGEVLTFSISYTNVSTRAVTAFPTSSNLAETLPPTAPNCRFADLAAGATAGCSTAKHIVTAADVAAGSFTPTVTFDATTTSDGSTVLQSGITVTLPAIATEAGDPRDPRDPATVPTEREDGEYVTLGTANYMGFTCHRIPALTQANNGWILAAWDGRPGGCGDSPNPNSIVQRISKDGGKSWTPGQVIAQGKTGADRYGYSDPSYVVDRETGKIFAFFVNSLDQGFFGSATGVDPNNRNVTHAAVIESSDNGLTWSAPKRITDQITDVAQFKSRFAASGEGIQLRYGEHAGRLVQQYTFLTLSGVMQAVSVYSDDHGATWQAGTAFGTGMDENKVVELSNGDLMVNSRASDGTRARKIAISTDGGETYGPVRVDSSLIDPNNNAAITRAYPDAPEGSAQARMLLFTNAATTGGRSNGTVKLSYDDGATWSTAKVFEPGSMSYSTITPLDEPGTYGILFEGTSSTIRYMRVSLDWLGGLPVSVTAEPQNVSRGANTVRYDITNLSDEAVTLAVSPKAPTGWTASADPVTLAAGETVEAEVSVTVPDWADEGSFTLPLTVSAGDDSSTGAATLNVELNPVQNPSLAVPVTVQGTLPAQSGEGQANMFDGGPSTLWHTPWNTAVTLPLNIDLSVGDVAQELAYVSVTPRQSGSNGRIASYELYAGDALDALTKISSGTLPNTASAAVLPLDVTAKFVRLRVLSTYGDTVDKFVSIAELSVRAAQADDPAPTLAAISAVDAKVGSSLEVTPQATGTGPLRFAAEGLPAGLVIDEETGEITGAPTAAGTFEVLVTVTDPGERTAEQTFIIEVEAAPSPTPSASPTAKPTPTVKPTVKPTTPTWAPSVPYTVPGHHVFNGRQWNTTCEEYSQTTRCRTDIWATTVNRDASGGFSLRQGWAFNNLTYLPHMTRAQWKGNPLGQAGTWKAADGRDWQTVCDIAATGRGACRSYTRATVFSAIPKQGGYNFTQSTQWVFNNLVLFRQ